MASGLTAAGGIGASLLGGILGSKNAKSSAKLASEQGKAQLAAAGVQRENFRIQRLRQLRDVAADERVNLAARNLSSSSLATSPAASRRGSLREAEGTEDVLFQLQQALTRADAEGKAASLRAQGTAALTKGIAGAVGGVLKRRDATAGGSGSSLQNFFGIKP